jgi:hypothetical protein
VRSEKALRVYVRLADLQQNTKTLSSAQFVQNNMWHSGNSWWLSRFEIEHNCWVLYLRLPRSHSWGKLPKTLKKFLDLWMKETLIHHYEEVIIAEDDSVSVQNSYAYSYTFSVQADTRPLLY